MQTLPLACTTVASKTADPYHTVTGHNDRKRILSTRIAHCPWRAFELRRKIGITARLSRGYKGQLSPDTALERGTAKCHRKTELLLGTSEIRVQLADHGPHSRLIRTAALTVSGDIIGRQKLNPGDLETADADTEGHIRQG
jgi:hypothetical protein